MPVAGWLAEVDAWLARTPGFLAGKPLVVDVTGLAIGHDDFRTLLSELKARSVALLGVEGVEASWLGDGDPPLLTGGRTAGMVELPDSPPAPATGKSAYPTAVSPRAAASQPAIVQPAPAAPKPSGTLLIETSVRSGQAIVHPEGDVTVVGSVSSGAEIVAGGSIHIYGTLRGRALGRDVRQRQGARVLPPPRGRTRRHRRVLQGRRRARALSPQEGGAGLA
jgi:septum site-determining protein MinC